ncbi:hexokinase-1-like [Eupeodes corollae]|uniref:hexokinase-1-like n=1 Tax=Eupeodes corollae TaxID=290404 RepID=UPI00249008C0|nr:hexokinase-1-like [Eupeodes corollae]
MYEVMDLVLSNKEKCKNVVDLLQGLVLTDETIKQIQNVFISEMNLALNDQPSSLQMENTYIPELPDGKEQGVFLALDLGGTNFRVILMVLQMGHIIEETVQHYHITDESRTGCGDALFDYLAQCVDDFAKQNGLSDDRTYCMGFTFSFPMHQHSLNSGSLVTWTKSFNCTSVVGMDVVEKLRKSLIKCNRHNIEILAILNDTTGTLVQGARIDTKTRIGIVLGTGSNACYMELAKNVKHWETRCHGDHVIIDVEWGAFGDNGVLDFIKTDFDRAVDEGSLLRNSFTFEKYISGKYLGELCRVILEVLHKQKLFFPAVPKEKFPKPWTFGSVNVSKIEQDTLNFKNDNLLEIFSKLNLKFHTDYNDDDIQIIRYVCGLISKRAAQLLAINTSILLNRMEEKEITVAIDGSVYKHHPRLRHWISEYTKQMAPTKTSKFMLAEDGSGKGAALVAAIAMKISIREHGQKQIIK